MQLGEIDRADDPPGDALLAEGMAAGQGTEAGPVIDQPQVELLGETLLGKAHQAQHHLLEIGPPLQVVGLLPFAVAILQGLSEPQMVPALAHSCARAA